MKKTLSGLVLAAIFLTSCKSTTTTTTADSTTMKADKNKATALASEQAMIKHDTEGLVKDCAPGFIDYGNGEMKAMTSLDTIKAGLKDYYAAFPDFNGSNLSAAASGDTVFVKGTWTGTFKNAFMGMKPTGKSFKVDDVDIFTFNKDGKMTSHRSIQSAATFFAQLSVTPPAKK